MKEFQAQHRRVRSVAWFIIGLTAILIVGFLIAAIWAVISLSEDPGQLGRTVGEIVNEYNRAVEQGKQP